MENGIKDLLVHELFEMHNAEEQIVKALPSMVKAAESSELKKALEGHLKETRMQVLRLEKIFHLLKIKKRHVMCRTMKGLIEEGKEMLKKLRKKSPIRDAALISKAQRIEHFEICAYGTMRTFAKELGLHEVVDLLQQTLDEEGHANKKLTKIAEGGLLTSGVNHQANRAETQLMKELNQMAHRRRWKKVA